MNRLTAKFRSHHLRLAMVLAWLCTLAACNSSTLGVSGFVGNTPPTADATVFKALGTVGTPFTMLVSNSRSSWQVQGNVPLNIAIVNNPNTSSVIPPAVLVATKLSNNNNLLSLQVANGFNVFAVSSTTAPYGSVTVQTVPVPQIAPHANPDVRIFVYGPAGERFQGVVEDSAVGFVINQRVPTLFLFDTPNGKIDGNFTQIQSFGPFAINMSYNGQIVATASGIVNVIIRQP
ncbi:MAG: hypothetical protein ACYDBH_23545 [Acidobacteriaceae bacterium]